jgi:hypothetical protein
MFLPEGQDEEDQEIAWEVSGNKIGICKFLKATIEVKTGRDLGSTKLLSLLFMKINET